MKFYNIDVDLVVAPAIDVAIVIRVLMSTYIQEANTFVGILRFRIDTPLLSLTLATEVDQVEVI